MRKFGLIGYPLSHSFSPAYFKEKFEQQGITDCRYDAYPISSVGQFADLIKDPALEGINVTIPYKKSVIRFLHSSSDAVRKIAACNCIRIKGGKLTGHNTDVIGFEKSLLPKLGDDHRRALILGTGGSAAAVEYVLQKLKIDYRFVSRNKVAETVSYGYEELNGKILEDYTLIINTTPLGMFPNVNVCPNIPYDFLTSNHYLFDLVYNPAETLFLKRGAEKGAATKNGADMLVIQAEESWKIWNDE